MRRCINGSCELKTDKLTRLDLPVATILTNPKMEWARIASANGASRVAKSIQTDWSEYNTQKYLFSHCSLVSSVATEKDGHTIVPCCSDLINKNANAWSNQVLLATFKTLIGGENYCFVAGTEVVMADGTYKNIEDVNIGDLVLTHTGKTRKVSYKFERKYEGEAVSIKLNHYGKPIVSTPNHPFRSLVIKCDPLTKYDGNQRSVERYKRDQEILALRGEKTLLKNFSVSGEWVSAENLSRYVLGEQIVNGDVKCEKLASLLGYYLAEGCRLTPHAHKGVVFVFGSHERKIVDHVAKLSKEVFPDARVVIVDKTDNGSVFRVEVRSEKASSVLSRLGGSYSHLKKLADEVWSWDRESLLALIVSWLEGDGDFHTETGRMRGATVSKDLAQQMLRVSRLCGLKASLVDKKTKIGEKSGKPVAILVGGEKKLFDIIARHNCWSLHVSSGSVGEIIKRSVRWEGFVPDERRRQTFDEWEGKKVYIVDKTCKYDVSTTVYNLEVEEDNSYVIAPGIAVHNCEHVQIKEQSKGKILDAICRPITYSNDLGSADIYFVDILVATSRAHSDLIRRIESGECDSMSMGCLAAKVQCSKCGQIFTDSDVSCQHIQKELLTTYSRNGKVHTVAELCGASELVDGIWVGDPKSCQFIEASWVARPAFQGAVINHFVIPTEEQMKVNIKIKTAQTGWLDDMCENLFQLRVADASGMMMLRLAREELLRRKRLAMIERLCK